MSTLLDARQVLVYLNQLGYQNITAKQLKEFMKDLKKLIKYEKRRKQTDSENIAPPTTSTQFDKFATLYSTPTESSKAKEVPKKEHIVSVQIKKPTHTCHIRCDNFVNNEPFHSAPHPSEVNRSQQELHTQVPEVSTCFSTEEGTTNVSPKRPKSCDLECQKTKSKVKFRGNVLRPKASFIIPRAPARTTKSDPVALYHKYQEGWKRQKLPGEDNHSELRWAIRERMLGQPRAMSVMSAATSMEAIARKRKTAQRI